ncbi:hemerythrin-like metal-binding protein [Thermodesulfatator indicus DSM 15286]|uniref:Hemerythrin-like metal-binding protein n=1 Tax=Thermodesulfatator indicus (strain DSM 15286 / JCM 11887 / CIR29812) TaxID=667014 RepID=F8ADA9_THEID|nr:bacteriohemerythrin [Thermodesulfatator indicus]AEH45924.1 hemerythrin-like metal-binding protein [Thermodesulfatator indicus DSM 15286]
MSFIKWQDEFLTGVSQIDAQHQQLIETLNRLHVLLRNKNPSKEEIDSVLNFLTQYTVDHFGTEEHLMKTTPGFPEDLKERHFKQHRYFIDKVQEFRGVLEDYHQGQNERRHVLDLFAFLSYWLCEHILKIDKETAKYFQKPPEISIQAASA